MTENNTLIIKHLPEKLGHREREELLKLFGAKKVRCMPDKGRLKYTAFALFDTHEDAKHALTKLHQTKVLNCYLTVEFAKEQYRQSFPKESDFPPFNPQVAKDQQVSKVLDKEVLKQETENFDKHIHGLCPSFGLDYIPSPLLRYKYPEPTSPIIANISHALVAVPKFYNQVLHLMNKMNLPAPFGPVTPAPPVSDDTLPVHYESQIEVEQMDASLEESELESDSEITTVKSDVNSSLKRTKTIRKHFKKHKLQNLISLTSSISSSGIKQDPSQVFDDQLKLDSQKKISFNIKPSLEENKSSAHDTESLTSEDANTTGFGIIVASKPSGDMKNKDLESGENNSIDLGVISMKELREKKISEREMKTLSVYKNYSPGEPTVRLYIKNLARQVDEKDLRYIFGHFINANVQEEKNMFDVRLMKEGRMKGQAFVTLANEQQAAKAVQETNGFVLHTKPLVVQFARSAKPKEMPTKAQPKK